MKIQFKCKVGKDGSFKRPDLKSSHCTSKRFNNDNKFFRECKKLIRSGSQWPPIEMNVNSLPDNLVIVDKSFLYTFSLTL